MFLLPYISIVFIGFISAIPGPPSSNEQLELLIDQVYPEISTYLSRNQVGELFTQLGLVVRSAKTLEEIARGMSKPILSTLTAEQKSEIWESIQKAEKKFGGFQQLKVIFFHSMDAVQNFMGDAMDKDRADVTLRAKGKSEEMKMSLIYETFRQYFNIEFGQKVMDTVKNSMTQEDWAISIEDAHKYMNIDNFDMTY